MNISTSGAVVNRIKSVSSHFSFGSPCPFLQSADRSTTRPQSPSHRLTRAELSEARYHRLKQMKMSTILREILSYCSFIWIIYLISYSNRNPNAFLQVHHLRHFLLNLGHSHHDYTKVNESDERQSCSS